MSMQSSEVNMESKIKIKQEFFSADFLLCLNFAACKC